MSFLLHFLIFCCIHFGVFLDKRLIFIIHFGLIIFIFDIKLSVKRFRHFVCKSLSLDFVFHIPTWQKLIHFFPCLSTVFKIPLTVKDKILDIKVVTDFAQEVKISLVQSHIVHRAHELLNMYFLRKILKAEKLLKTNKKIGRFFALVNMGLKKVYNSKGHYSQSQNSKRKYKIQNVMTKLNGKGWKKEACKPFENPWGVIDL